MIFLRVAKALGFTIALFLVIIGIPVVIVLLVPVKAILPLLLMILFLVVFVIFYKELG